MAKSLKTGVSYAGHADISPDDVTEPEWVPADQVKADEPEPKAERKAEDKPERKPAPRSSTRKH
jgi:hypothetical protein